MKNIIKLVISFITASVLALASTGCSLFVKDTGEIKTDNVETFCSLIKAASTTSVALVCAKNTDLKPVFKAIGEGLVAVSGTADAAYTPEQLSTYIMSLVKVDDPNIKSAVKSTVSSIVDVYSTFYKNNKDNFQNWIPISSQVMAAVGNGFIVATSDSVSTKANENLQRQNEIAFAKLNAFLENK